ncbi:LysR substrate-binding domain-containing protein [Phyllobacterium zundukense]|uniref:LysR substrate-binding domain-containing protein n=1 Tax=Phyllobacterium zundukense TaxID=1867719 RepID=A0ACD4CXN1_9HYPH|nr:LysR substrate-binding domain-containing protein [Phyllobacterium zundukense]UXN58318.1 LysR substrate-binding domain-containing protein [Phyllobacterium zundukense]
MTAEAMLASRKREVSGLLRINLPISFGRLCVMPVLMDVAVKNPNLQLDISFADRGVDLMEEGIDLVVRLSDPGNQASLVGRRMARNTHSSAPLRIIWIVAGVRLRLKNRRNMTALPFPRTDAPCHG